MWERDTLYRVTLSSLLEATAAAVKDTRLATASLHAAAAASIRTGDLHGARALLTMLCAKDSGHAPGWTLLALVCHELHDPIAADFALARARVLAPADPLVRRVAKITARP